MKALSLHVIIGPTLAKLRHFVFCCWRRILRKLLSDSYGTSRYNLAFLIHTNHAPILNFKCWFPVGRFFFFPSGLKHSEWQTVDLMRKRILADSLYVPGNITRTGQIRRQNKWLPLWSSSLPSPVCEDNWQRFQSLSEQMGAQTCVYGDEFTARTAGVWVMAVAPDDWWLW